MGPRAGGPNGSVEDGSEPQAMIGGRQRGTNGWRAARRALHPAGEADVRRGRMRLLSFRELEVVMMEGGRQVVDRDPFDSVGMEEDRGCEQNRLEDGQQPRPSGEQDRSPAQSADEAHGVPPMASFRSHGWESNRQGRKTPSLR